MFTAATATAAAQAVPFTVAGDGIVEPLAGATGDATRGRAIVASRQLGLCLLCHSGPFPEERQQGNIATHLAGAGSRWSVPQLRLRVADGRLLDPQSLMPAFHRADGLTRAPAGLQGRPILTAQQVEDVVAFLATLKQ